MPFEIRVNWRGFRSSPVLEVETSFRGRDGSWPLVIRQVFLEWSREFRGVDVLRFHPQRRVFALAVCRTALSDRRYVLVQVGRWTRRLGWRRAGALDVAGVEAA